MGEQASASASASAAASGSGTRIVPRTRAQGPETVLVVGGGATGLVTLRNLVEERGVDEHGSFPYFEPTLVERRPDVGGVWYFSDQTYELERQLGPASTQGQVPLLDPASGKPHWPSPAYLNLRGNVLPEFLQFSGLKFPPPANGETFPSLQETHDYLKAFSAPYRRHIRCGVEVVRVEELADDKGWQVTTKDWNVSPSPESETAVYDRVVVATGWYDAPYFPDARGFQQAKAAGHVHHCKHYRDSSFYRGKKVVVIGNGNSANEVAAHLAVHASKESPVYKSAKSAQDIKFPSLPDERIVDVGMITHYRLQRPGWRGSCGQVGEATETAAGTVETETDTKLELEIQDGTVIRDVDYVLLGTGYGHRYPFVHVLTDEARRQGGLQHVEQLTPDSLQGTRVPSMYNHCLFSKSRSLSLGFVGLIVSFMPFSLADLVSAWLVAVWTGHITSVPLSIDARLQNEKDRLEYILSLRRETLLPGDPPPNPSNPASYAGYHLLGNSLETGPPSELHFATTLLSQLEHSHPSRARLFEHKWDAARERMQYNMYEVKKQWLFNNQARIRSDPFDLLGHNNKYKHLAPLLVHPSLLSDSHHASRAQPDSASPTELAQQKAQL
ncbi:FAD/NAD(P)-binding domain-containing protein [Testicularia cyperi]|uniref:FAD/NAD(P)-binding domain-containing protein n=1 Tax=Testicularia cyperi TaxID=1882483 RepID=A0A317XRI5_9BASI|nr:FAD/NAD(P)-binding domain-containing protein [Testicularia cyperi]